MATKTGNYRSKATGEIKSYATGQVVAPAAKTATKTTVNSVVTNPVQTAESNNYQAPSAPLISQVPDTGHPELNQLLTIFQNELNANYAKGMVLNPNINITTDIAQKFMDQAMTEQSPYYKGLYDSYKNDITSSLGTLKTQSQNAVDQTGQGFNTDLRQSQNQAGETGMALSGQRVINERNLANTASRDISNTTSSYNNQANSAYNQALRTIGSTNLTGVAPTQINTPDLSSFNAGNTAASATNPNNLNRTLSPAFNLSTNVTGSLEDQQKKAQIDRATQLGKAYIDQQSRQIYGQ